MQEAEVSLSVAFFHKRFNNEKTRDFRLLE